MGSLKRISTILLLTFLTVGASNCQHAIDFPQLPKHDIYQPIIEQLLCDGENCEVKSMCKQWSVNEKNEWTLVENHPLKICHGKLAITSDTFIEYRDFYRKMKTWIKGNCNGSASNGEFTTGN